MNDDQELSIRPKRRQVLCAAAALAACSAGAARAQDARTVRLIVGFPAGGPTDTAARIVGEKLGEWRGRTVLVDNRAGASGTLAASIAAKAPKDGGTWMMMATPTLLAPHLYGPREADLLKDFAPVATIYDLPIVLVVNPQVLPDVTSLPRLVHRAKADPGKLDYTSSGNGSFGHITTEQLKAQAGFTMQHVPYKGSAPAVADVLGGQVPVMFADLVSVLPHIKAGKLRAIAVGSAKRVPALPDVPGIAEQGFPGFDATSWGGMVVPAGVAPDFVQKLSDDLRRVLSDPGVQQRLAAAGADAHWQSAKAMAERMRRDDERWGKVVRERQIRAG